MKHKMWSRLLSMALAVMMIVSIVPNSAFAEAANEITSTSQVQEIPAEETQTPEEVTVPEAETPAEPSTEPAPTEEPVAEPTAEPTVEPTAEPTQAPAETAVPSEQPSAEPTAAPEATETPNASAQPSETPAASATPAPSESPVPSETPAPSEEPAIDGQAMLDELMAIEDDEAFMKAVSELTEEQTAALEALGEEALAEYTLRVESLTAAQQQEEKFTELYEKLMAAETADEVEALLGALSEEEGRAFSNWLDDGKTTALTDKLIDLGFVDTIEYGPVAKNYSNAGPLLAPITIDATSVSSLKRARSSVSVADDTLLDVKEIITNKTVTDISTENESKYRIQLEAYTTGEVTSGEISVPSDIVLVLDESGSMDYSIGSGPVYSGELDTSKTYYMIDGNDSRAIQYNAEKGSWGYRWRIFPWGDWEWEQITPTTGPEDNNSDHVQLYTNTTTRKNAIINAVNGFLDQVKADNQNLPEDVTPHRVGVIGFSEGSFFSDAAHVIRELETSLDHLNSNDLKASNGTYVDAGLDLVDDVFNRGNSQVTGQTRNRVVIVFTDGDPGTGDWDNSASKECAADAINTAKTLKNTYGATVFSVGIFNGADPSDTNGLSNQFMNAVSSNYKSATATYSNRGYSVDLGDRATAGDYYLSASNTDTLNEIFEKIADQTTNPSITLKNASVVDEVEQYFALPSSTSDVTVQVQKATAGGGFEGPLTPADGVRVEFDEQKVIVKGYDFDQHYVTTEAKPGTTNDYGEKLVITFEITPKKEFWGGNKVPTNVTATSGVLAEVNGENKLLENFPKPDPVDVPLKEITLTGKEVNVYYSGETPGAADLVNQITVPGNWTTDYVNQTIEYEFVAEGPVSNETDGEYAVKATLKPLYTDGTEGPTYASATGSVKVYKPELTWKDTTKSSGTVLTDDTLKNQLVNKTWKHEKEEYTPTSMLGTEPTLNYVFHANDADGRALNQTQLTDETNVYVAVTSDGTNLNGVTTFIRMRGEQCPGDCTANGNVVEDTTHFCIHLDNGELIIEKTVTKWNNAKGNDAAFVFKIEGGGKTYYCTINLNATNRSDSETITLPAGTYTVTELPTAGYKLDDTVEGNAQERSVVVSGNAGDPVKFTNTSNGDKTPGDNSSVLNKWLGDTFAKVTSEAANG